MPYCFRYRVRVCTPPDVPRGSSTTISLPGFSNVTMVVTGSARPFGRWVIFSGHGFADEKSARSAGEILGDALTILGGVGKLGIDIGFSRSTFRFSGELLEAMGRSSGRETRTEIHGLMTYEENTISIVGIDARASATIAAAQFEKRLAVALGHERQLTERQRICLGLINDSYFAMSSEAQFILCISAVEALCEQTDGDKEYQDSITKLGDHLNALLITPETRAELKERLDGARRQTIGQAYRRKFRSLLGDDEAKAFGILYGRRSRFLHDGQDRGNLQSEANEARDLATQLVEADCNA